MTPTEMLAATAGALGGAGMVDLAASLAGKRRSGVLARAVGATAVITTASDALGVPAVDLLGRDWGWKIEGGEHLTAVAAAVVRGESVGVWQDAGRRDSDAWKAAAEISGTQS